MEESNVILKVENISKQYRLGTLGTGTISHDLNRWWHRIRGKEDPYLKIGETNDRSTKGTSEYVWALKDVSFEVKKGEILGIIGKNGAGKSTLLKILSRVTGPTTGSIKTKGRIVSLLEVGTGFHPEMTGRENVYLNGAILGMTKKEINEKIDEIISFSGCERYIDTPTKRYSSGMTVRLAFAVAAFLEPDILVVDEVLAVGDAEFQKKAIGKMQDISNSDGRTVLFVSHDMAAIQSLCTELLVLGNGVNLFQGNVSEGVDFYLSDKNQEVNSDLLSLTIRKGNKTSLFKKISFTSNTQGKEFKDSSKVYSGSKIFIDIEIENKRALSREIYIAMDFVDSKGIAVMNISNEFTKNKLYLKDKKSIIRFEIANLNLRSMDYYISLWGCEVGGSVFDFIENQIKMEVIETDFFRTGAIPRGKQHGYILLANNSYNFEK
ncbi:ABC transporter ATP-binding protein [Wenyingzhuangia marina]|uniref:Lipopolysaccharide transport system ATP-binding protein n=1 Tax=Wenyingzhuangia marina TaxID=1195760 RepID=A0A1M5U9Z4_9FLAO|nr:ABC transporter ATP-binding protein [Wenyingzhuangia marina]GGF68756.1 ABC transporter ATP-binding protein [Wenyingzhuangia marina]SHH59875.1 lipopolysaccharide transport system ATP-binding protein [Wenyingzhuangia marina]